MDFNWYKPSFRFSEVGFCHKFGECQFVFVFFLLLLFFTCNRNIKKYFLKHQNVRKIQLVWKHPRVMYVQIMIPMDGVGQQLWSNFYIGICRKKKLKNLLLKTQLARQSVICMEAYSCKANLPLFKLWSKEVGFGQYSGVYFFKSKQSPSQ